MDPAIPPNRSEPNRAIPIIPNRVRWRIRLILLALGIGLIAVFVTAWRLNPYDENGRPLRQETHRQLGMPPCEFYERYNRPCPACGLTTSFSLLMHGDILASLRANFVGTLMALFGLVIVPFCAFVALRGRLLGMRSLEPIVLASIGAFAILLMLRWGFVMLLHR